MHDPGSSDRHRDTARKGGMKGLDRVPPLPPETPDVDLKSAEDVRVLISDTISRLRRGEMEQAVCSAIGHLSQVALKSIEQGELNERLKKLEQQFEQVDRRSGTRRFQLEAYRVVLRP